VVNKAKSGGAQSVTAYGNPAYAQYQPTLQSTTAHGQAQMITYNFPSYLFIFKNQARLEQNNNIFTGPLITYNTKSKEVHSPTNKLVPTIITLPPYNQEKFPHD
jgi:lipopolysaccharide transport protein LptA